MSMIVQTADYLEAISHLPPGGKLTLYEIDWEEYERLLDLIGDRARLRVHYDRGRIEIMSPSARHERYKNLIHDLVMILGDELARDIVSFGSVTLKLPALGKGAEGDDCFYIGHAAAVAGKDRLDLSVDPPPDLLVEIDLTHESSEKMSIYAAFGVPEIWRFDGRRWEILQLTGDSWLPVSFSPTFDFLRAEDLADFIANHEKGGSYQIRRAFRDWVRAQISSPS